MQIIYDFPPLFDEINIRFHIRGKPVIFAWGDVIYNPSAIVVSPMLIEHETVHAKRQGNDVEGWWRRYIDDDAFRLQEELLGHMAEYKFLTSRSSNRAERRRALKQTAKRLALPIYGYSLTTAQATKLLQKAAENMPQC